MNYRVPLFDASRVPCAWAKVDEADYWRVLGFRWFLTGAGYAGTGNRTRVGGATQLMHRLLFDLEYKDSACVVDHINRDRLDNRRGNLRVVDRRTNAQNVTVSFRARSKYRGVSWNKQARKWVAQCKLNGQTKYLGLYETEEEAAEVARLFRLEHMVGAVD